MLTVYQLKTKAEKFAREYWDMDFNLPIKVSGRLTRALGQYVAYINRDGSFKAAKELKIAKALLENYNEDIIDSVIKHELTHWALSIQGLPYNDGHPVFEKELRRVDAHSTGVIKFVGTLHQGVCSKCGKLRVERDSPGKVTRYAKNRNSGCCGATIVLGSSRVINNEHGNSTISQPKKPVQPKEKAVAAAAIETATIETPIITPGPRGVTNKQMIPAIREALDLNSKERLEILKRDYPSVYEGTLRYIGKSYYAKLIQIMGN